MAAPENAMCIDVDPDAGTGPSYGELQFNALVTDGTKSTGSAEDGCNGAPVQDVQVVWVIEDDTPDAWFSSQDAVATIKTVEGGNANPNSVTTQTKADGTTFVKVQSNEPLASGDNRFSGHFGDDVPEPGSNTVCDLPEPLGYPCPGEGPNEDDVSFSWMTATPSPTPTASPSPAKAERDVSMISPEKVKSGAGATFSGCLTSADASCVADQFVKIQRRVAGEELFSEFDSTSTDATDSTDSTGGHLLTRSVDFNAEYRALVGPAAGPTPPPRRCRFHPMRLPQPSRGEARAAPRLRRSRAPA